MTRKKAKLILLGVALLVGTPAWIYLLVTDWKLAVVLLAITWANNLTVAANNY